MRVFVVDARCFCLGRICFVVVGRAFIFVVGRAFLFVDARLFVCVTRGCLWARVYVELTRVFVLCGRALRFCLLVASMCCFFLEPFFVVAARLFLDVGRAFVIVCGRTFIFCLTRVYFCCCDAHVLWLDARLSFVLDARLFCCCLTRASVA